MRALAVVVATVAIAFAAPCGAAAQWSDPRTVSGKSTFVDSPSIVFSGDGRGLATWAWQEGVGESADRGVRAASREPYGDFGAERTGPALAAAPATYGSGRAVALERRPAGGGRERLSVRFGNTYGRFGRGYTLTRARLAGAPALSAAVSGHAVAAWIERRGDRRIVLVSWRRPGGRFSHASVVRGSGRADAVSAAVNDSGSLIVAWARDGCLEARVRHRQDGFGNVQALGPAARGGENRIVTAVMSSLRAYVAWSSRQLSEGGDTGLFVVRAAVRPAGSSRPFRPAQVLERASGDQPQEARLSLAVGAGPVVTLAWSAAVPAAGPLGVRFAARVASTNRFGTFEPSQTLSPPGQDAAVSDVAASPHGPTLVVWSRLDEARETGVQVLAALRLPGARAFLPPEAVSSPGERARVPDAAFDPRSARITVVWSARIGPEGPGVPPSRVRTYLRASARTG